MSNVVHFGCNDFALGFIAPVFDTSASDHGTITLVDIDSPLFQRLSHLRSFSVTEFDKGGRRTQQSKITSYHLLNAATDEKKIYQAIAEANTVTITVDWISSPRMIPSVIATHLRRGIQSRRPGQRLTVIDCGKYVGDSGVFECLFNSASNWPQVEGLLQRKATFTHCCVDRIISVAVQDPCTDTTLDVKVEKLSGWHIDKTPFKDSQRPEPSFKDSHYTLNMDFNRKLKSYVTHTGLVVTAYLAINEKITYIHEAIRTPNIKAKVRRILSQTSTLVPHLDPGQSKIAIRSSTGAEDWRDRETRSVLDRLANPALELTAERVVSQGPMNRLSPDDCLIGPATELAKSDEPADVDGLTCLLPIIEMAFRFHPPLTADEKERGYSTIHSKVFLPTPTSGSREIHRKMKDLPLDQVITEVTGLGRDQPLFSKLQPIVGKVQREVQKKSRGTSGVVPNTGYFNMSRRSQDRPHRQQSQTQPPRQSLGSAPRGDASADTSSARLLRSSSGGQSGSGSRAVVEIAQSAAAIPEVHANNATLRDHHHTGSRSRFREEASSPGGTTPQSTTARNTVRRRGSPSSS